MAEKKQPNISYPDGFPAEYYAALLAGLIHKQNNIITVLTGHTGLLLLEPSLSADILQPIQQMSRATQLLSRYIDETAVVTKATPLHPEPINLSEYFKLIENPPGLLISKQFDDTLKVSADRRKLKEILEQIFQNASEAAAKSAMVTAEHYSGFVQIKIRDNGQGIKPPVMARIFDPFFSTRKPDENFGLGLFRAKGELARMKGDISAESDGKTYTEILVRLPAG